MRSLYLSAILLVAMCIPASASGSLSCTIESKKVELSLEGSFSHGVGEGLVNAGGTLALHSDTVRTSKVTLERENVTQYWLSGPDLKLRLYHEPTEGEHEEIDIVIETKVPKGSDSDETTYKGTFVATLRGPLPPGGSEGKTETAKGSALCSVGY